MPDVKKQEIKCPNSKDHTHKKILLLLGKNDISVYCRDHGWISIELHRGGEKLNFENVSAKITSHPKKGLNFVLSPTPGIAIGEFENRKKSHGNS